MEKSYVLLITTFKSVLFQLGDKLSPSCFSFGIYRKNEKYLSFSLLFQCLFFGFFLFLWKKWPCAVFFCSVILWLSRNSKAFPHWTHLFIFCTKKLPCAVDFSFQKIKKDSKEPYWTSFVSFTKILTYFHFCCTFSHFSFIFSHKFSQIIWGNFIPTLQFLFYYQHFSFNFSFLFKISNYLSPHIFLKIFSLFLKFSNYLPPYKEEIEAD